VLLGNVPEYSISLWHGFNLPLAMSTIALLLGAALYFGLQRGYNLHLYRDDGISAKRLFDRLLEASVSTARLVTALVQNGSLQRSLWLLLVVVLSAGAIPFFRDNYSIGDELLLPSNGAALAMWIALVAAVSATVALHRKRLLSLVALGAVGLLVSLVFVLFSAPDLALTQLAVEVVTVVLLMAALRHLPAHTPVEGTLPRHLRDALLSLAAGIGMTVLAYAALTRPLASISTYFLEQSVPKGGGANVVNVILVDFRGYDTLVEILVLAVAGLVTQALLAGFVAPGPATVPDAENARPLMLRVLARLILPFALAVSAYLFLRGHNQPGGGFVAGLVTAIALLVQYMAGGRDAVPCGGRGAIPPRPVPAGDEGFDRWIAAGMFTAVLTGLGATAIGFPFLTSAYAYFDLPLLGKVPLASAMFFDAGVYLTVVGSTMMMIASIGRVAAAPACPAATTGAAVREGGV
jgi:multicomponent K+:H+ antiporter subunit A